MQTLGFDNYVEPLKLYLQKYREVRPHVAYVYFPFVKFATLPFWREAAELKYWPVLNFYLHSLLSKYCFNLLAPRSGRSERMKF